MAFTDQEKTKILYFLGYSVFEDDGPVMRAIHSLDSKEPQGGRIIRDILAHLETIETQIMETIPLASAIEDGSIKLRAHYTLDHLCKLGKMQIVKLARFTKTTIAGDVFSTSGGARGDDYSDPSEPRATSSIPFL